MQKLRQMIGGPIPVTCKRHPEFYYKDGTAVLMAYDSNCSILYRLHMGILCKRSAILNSIFSLPSQGADGDGRTDERPFILPSSNINPKNFENLLVYLLCGPSEHPSTDEFLTDVLELSTFLEIDDGINYAIQQFEQRTFFCPILQFSLARCFRVDHWIEPAFRKLMELPTVSISLADAERIGIVAYHWLMLTKARIELLRKGMAFNYPTVFHSDDCMDRDGCEDLWANEWWDNYAQTLLHPDTSYVGHQMQLILERAFIKDMKDGCLELTVLGMKAKGVFDKDEEYISEAVADLMTHQTDKHIREMLPDYA